jgi:hypothetical protein
MKNKGQFMITDSFHGQCNEHLIRVIYILDSKHENINVRILANPNLEPASCIYQIWFPARFANIRKVHVRKITM